MKRAIVHMGMPKTATSAFQSALFQHRQLLLDKYRILYPSTGENHATTLCPMFLPDPRTHIMIRMANVTSLEEAKKLAQGYFDDYDKELRQDNWDTVVFSGEGLSNLQKAPVQALYDWVSGYADEVEAIYWLRHPVNYAVSVIQQMLKNGRTLEEMADHKTTFSNYRPRIQNAIRAFGKDNLRIYRFEDMIKQPGGPIGAFCTQIGLPEDTTSQIASGSYPANQSMSNRAAKVINELNHRVPMFKDGKRNPLRGNHEVALLMRLGGPRFDLDDEQKQKIREAARPEIAWLTEEFGRDFYPDILED